MQAPRRPAPAVSVILGQEAATWPELGVIGGVVLAIVVLGMRRVWLFTWQHEAILGGERARREIAEREAAEWKRLALEQAGLLRRSVQVTEKLTDQAVTP